MNYIEFCQEIKILAREKMDCHQNKSTDEFLEAMEAWLKDTKGGKNFFHDCFDDKISWVDLLTLLKASYIYE